jgi:hypothetical protein
VEDGLGDHGPKTGRSTTEEEKDVMIISINFTRVPAIVRVHVLMATSMKKTAFWDIVSSYSLVLVD